jgi:hypothetical protein
VLPPQPPNTQPTQAARKRGGVPTVGWVFVGIGILLLVGIAIGAVLVNTWIYHAVTTPANTGLGWFR